MIRRLREDTHGGATLEFAILAPLCLALLFGGMALGIAGWNRNILQEVAYETSRCVALAAAPCATAPQTCSGSAPGVCFAMRRTAERGLANVPAANVALNANATLDGVSYTTVSITHAFNLAGYQIPLTGYAVYPNGG